MGWRIFDGMNLLYILTIGHYDLYKRDTNAGYNWLVYFNGKLVKTYRTKFSASKYINTRRNNKPDPYKQLELDL
jgi:hypothetical protein